MTADLDQITVTKAYARWAPVYDLVFGAVFERGRQAAIAAAERVGGQILEVGVGTGISLPSYSKANRIVGIDLCEPMLRKAQERVAELSLHNVLRLEVMDAEHLSFEDASFDVVAAHHVVSTCPHPEAALDEFVRVLRPGGEIILITRVASDGGRSSRGTDLRVGPTGGTTSISSSAGPCRPLVISHSSDSEKPQAGLIRDTGLGT
jgi:phosphatidylethanolamine/phosphatidyl-N-methylethanolamine N-methyltransferase